MRARHEPVPEPVGPMTFEEYLAFEEQAEIKHEFVDGYAYPHGDWATGLAGAGRRHNDVAYELLGLLINAARGLPECRVYGSDQRLYIAELDKTYYPDVQVVCDPTDRNENYSERPCLLVEVTSPNTSRVDRGEKLLAYQRLPSLKAYWIVSPTQRSITRWWYGPDQQTWIEEQVTSGELPVPCLEATLSLEAIYARTRG
jgi:Uma2 family endonuclease